MTCEANPLWSAVSGQWSVSSVVRRMDRKWLDVWLMD